MSHPTVTLSRITMDDPEYERELELRFRVLREPLGIKREDVTYPYDLGSLHWVAKVSGEVIGCVLFHPEGEKTGRLLQMAVAPELQGKGIGRDLVRTLERDVKERGFEEVTLHARGDKVGFYEKLGYELFGEPFTEVGIPHRYMRRRLG